MEIMGNMQDYFDYIQFFNRIKDDYIKKTGFDFTKYIRDFDVDKEWQTIIYVHPDSFFVYIIQCDNVPPRLRELIETDDTYWYKSELEKIKSKVAPYDWSEPKYEISTKFTIDWSKFKYNRNFNYISTGLNFSDSSLMDCYYVDANDIKHDLKFYESPNSKYPKWIIDPSDYFGSKLINYYSTDYGCSGFLRVKSMKSLRRWLRKSKFPKGTVIKMDFGCVDSDITIKCN